eukprot:g67616.t1
MDDEDDLLYSVHELGVLNEDGVWIASQDHIEHLKKIGSFLKRDDPQTQRLRLCLGQWESVRTHLLPLFLSYRDDEMTVFACVKIFARLSMPFTEEMKDQVRGLEYLQALKEDFLNRDALAVLVMWIAAPLAKSPGQRTEEDIGVLELFLTLFKNLLQIPNPSQYDSPTQQYLHDRCLLAFSSEQVFDAIILLAEQLPLDRELSKRCDLLMLELFYHLFRQESADSLLGRRVDDIRVEENATGSSSSSSKQSKSKGKSGGKYESAEKKLLVAQLEATRKKVQERNRQFSRKMPSRHSRFGTMMCLKSRLEPDRIEVLRNPFSQQGMLLSDRLPTRVGRKPLLDKPDRRFYNEEVRRVICRAAGQLVDRAFNNVFSTAFTVLSADINHRDEDARNLMELGAFILGFHRLDSRRKAKEAVKRNKARAAKRKAATDGKQAGAQAATVSKQEGVQAAADGKQEGAQGAGQEQGPERVGIDPEPVETALQKQIFRWVVDKINAQMEMKPAEYGKMPPFVRYYTELVHVVHEMTLAPEGETRSYAKGLVGFIFYDPYCMYLPCTLLKMYKPTKNTRGFLADLVVSSHYALRVLKGAAHRGVTISRKARRKVRVKHKAKKTDKTAEAKGQEEKYEEDYEVDEAEQKGREAEEDQDKQESKQEQTELEARPLVSVGEKQHKRKRRILLGADSDEEEDTEDKNAQAEPTPEDTKATTEQDEDRPSFLFGEEEQQAQEESGKQKTAEKADAEGDEQKQDDEGSEVMKQHEKTPQQERKRVQETGEGQEEEEGEEEEEVRIEEYYKEQRLDFAKYLHKFAHPIIIKNYIYLLEGYYHNPPELNAMVVRFLHRLAFDEELGLVCMFFQLSVFDLFDRILGDAAIQKDKDFRDLRTLCKKVVRKFFDMAKENPMLFCEALFWKPYMLASDLLHPLPIQVSFDEELGEMDVRTVHTQRDRFGRILQRKSRDDLGDDDPANDEVKEFMPLPEFVDVSYSRRKWSEEEDKILTENYPLFKDSSDCFEILAQMLMRGRSAAQTQARLRKLGVLEGGAAGGGRARKKTVSEGRKAAQSDDDAWEEGGASGPPSLVAIEEQVLTQVGRLASSAKGLEAVDWLRQELLACQGTRDTSTEEEPEDFALIPIGEDAFKQTRRGPLTALMKTLGFRAPNVDRHHVFWRVPANKHSGHLEGVLGLLLQAKDEAVKAKEAEDAEMQEGEEEEGEMEEEEAEDAEEKRSAKRRAKRRAKRDAEANDGVEVNAQEGEGSEGGADEGEEEAASDGQDKRKKKKKDKKKKEHKHKKDKKKWRALAEAEGQGSDEEVQRLEKDIEDDGGAKDVVPDEEDVEDLPKLRRRRERAPWTFTQEDDQPMQKTQTPEQAPKKRRALRRVVADEDSEDEGDQDMAAAQEAAPAAAATDNTEVKRTARRKRLADEEEDGEEAADGSPPARKMESPPRKRQKRRMIADDDDDETEEDIASTGKAETEKEDEASHEVEGSVAVEKEDEASREVEDRIVVEKESDEVSHAVGDKTVVESEDEVPREGEDSIVVEKEEVCREVGDSVVV